MHIWNIQLHTVDGPVNHVVEFDIESKTPPNIASVIREKFPASCQDRIRRAYEGAVQEMGMLWDRLRFETPDHGHARIIRLQKNRK